MDSACLGLKFICDPDVTAHDESKQFMALVFQSNSEMLHIETESIPIESLNSMSFVNVNMCLSASHKKFKSESPDTSGEDALHMAVKFVSDSVSPDSLVSTLPFYGALP